MAGTSILKCLLESCPGININAAYHKRQPFVNDKRVNYMRCDLNSVENCRDVSRDCGVAIMAASYAGGASFVRSYPWEHMKENLLMNVAMLEALRLEGIRRVIFISSAVVYQEFEGSIREEELDLNIPPSEAYFGFGCAMRFLEQMCAFINKKYGIETIVVRLANIFGPYDKFNPEVSNFVPAIIRKAAAKMDPFEVWGNPDVTRDVLYSGDFARAITIMALDSNIESGVFNLGSGVETTVGNVVDWALKYAGHKPSQVKYIQNKPTTIKFRALDCSKAKTVLGWQPEYSIEDAVKVTTEWWIKNQDTWKR